MTCHDAGWIHSFLAARGGKGKTQAPIAETHPPHKHDMHPQGFLALGVESTRGHGKRQQLHRPLHKRTVAKSGIATFLEGARVSGAK